MGGNRDIDPPFTRYRLNPDSSLLFSTELDLGEAPCGNILLFYVVLPYGFSGAPGLSGEWRMVLSGSTRSVHHRTLCGAEKADFSAKFLRADVCSANTKSAHALTKALGVGDGT